MSGRDHLGEETVVELRRYTLHPGRRDELIELFERALVAPQEAAGMTIIGQFRDIDHPDTFTWMRSFASMTSRRRALEAFYGGTTWAAHRDAANATMIDSDDVHLLRHVDGDRSADLSRRAAAQHTTRAWAVTVMRPAPGVRGTDIHRRLAVPGWTTASTFETLSVVNDVPRLPVHTHRVVVALLAASGDHTIEPAQVDALVGDLAAAATVWRLRPTSGSTLR